MVTPDKSQSPFRLSVCAEMVYPSLPFVERARKLNQAGFLVDFWTRAGPDIDELTKAKIPVGTMGVTTDGSMMHPDGVEPLLAGVRQRLLVAEKLHCTELNLLLGVLGPNGEVIHAISDHPATRWITAYKTLCRIAELAEKQSVIFNLEPLNTKTDHPGYMISRIGDAVRLIEQVGSPRVKILFDIYHQQVEEGNTCQLIRDYHSYVGYIHVADVPGRHEPGTGEINYPKVAQTLREVGYRGTVGLEAIPLADDEQALTRFREVFG